MKQTKKIGISKEEMERTRIARFKKLKGVDKGFLDSLLPDHVKQNFRVIGKGVIEHAKVAAPIDGEHGFSLGYVKCAPGKGAALHSHRTFEVFIPVNGKMTLIFGPEGEHEVEIAPWDVVSVPVGEMRAFRNPNSEDLYILTVIQGVGQRVEWHEGVIDEARKQGVTLDAEGNVQFTNA